MHSDKERRNVFEKLKALEETSKEIYENIKREASEMTELSEEERTEALQALDEMSDEEVEEIFEQAMEDSGFKTEAEKQHMLDFMAEHAHLLDKMPH
jgi:hypothetical protein